MSELKERVRHFVADSVGVSVERIDDHTTLFGDLGVDGDDGAELMAAFARRYDVDLSNFEITEYFGPEGVSMWTPLIWLVMMFRTGSPEQRAHLKAISLSDLVQAAAAGHWRREMKNGPGSREP